VRNSFDGFKRALGYLGSIHLFFGFVFLAPLLSVFLFPDMPNKTAQVFSFLLPSIFTFSLGGSFIRAYGTKHLESAREAVLVCVLGWLSVSAVGAVPFALQLDISYLDAYFETMSGFTTTGITVLSNLDTMAPSILLWRSMIQWLGGLGILALFLVFMFSSTGAHRIFTAESHKILARRPVPGLFRTLKILWTIYAILTFACTLLLFIGGMSIFDALCHALTTLSTGGYSTHDASIDYYRQAGYAGFAFIEYTLVFFMLLGGINFLVHFRLMRGDFRALYDSFEIKLFWIIIAAATAIVAVEHLKIAPDDSITDTIRYSIFQVVSILTTTGFGTKDIGTPFFGAGAKLIFLSLMVIGGCVGSTGGGVKVMRIGILWKMLLRQIKKILYPSKARIPLTLDGAMIEIEEIRRVGALFFAWIILLFLGGLITALFSNLGALESASGMFSALGNIGPCYITAQQITVLHPVVKVTYILGMLAGRLEILPVLLLFSKRAWK